MPEFGAAVRFPSVAALPSAAANAKRVLEHNGKLWFSNGSAWVDMTDAVAGSSPPMTVSAFRVRAYFLAGAA